jgi:probable HAF family extracellular repeat protein
MKRSCHLIALAMLASVAARAAAPSYTSTEIVSLAGSGGSITAYGINRLGEVVGTSEVPGGGQSAFVYSYSQRSIQPLDGEAAGGINDYGKIAGYQNSATTGPQAVAWYLTGGMDTLPANNLSMAGGVSNNGQVIGSVDNGHADNAAVVWSWKPTLHATYLGVLWSEPYLPDYATSTAAGINAVGHIAGYSTAGEGTDPNTAKSYGIHAFLYKSGTMQDLGALALSSDGSDDSQGRGINDKDSVVGVSTTAIPALSSTGASCADCGVATHAFLWTAGKMSDLGNIAGVAGWDSQADAINNQGQIVGWADSNVSGTATQRAFVYVNSQMYNLTFNVPARDLNVRLTEAVAINCNGWIVANGYDVRTPYVPRAYLLIPVGSTSTQCPAQ